MRVEDFLPNVQLAPSVAELITFQVQSNNLLQQSTDDKFAVIGIFLPEDSILKPEASPKTENVKYEFVISVSSEVSTKINQTASGTYSKKFPLSTPSQAFSTPGRIIFKLPIKNKPDISYVNEDDDLITADTSALGSGKIVLVEGLIKPYNIPGSSSGVLFELSSLVILGNSETAMVPSPTKRKIQEYLDQRKKEKNRH